MKTSKKPFLLDFETANTKFHFIDIYLRDWKEFKQKRILPTTWVGDTKKPWKRLRNLLHLERPIKNISTTCSKTLRFPWHSQVNTHKLLDHQTKYFIAVDTNSSGGLYELCVSLLETLSDRQIQIKYVVTP